MLSITTQMITLKDIGLLKDIPLYMIILKNKIFKNCLLYVFFLKYVFTITHHTDKKYSVPTESTVETLQSLSSIISIYKNAQKQQTKNTDNRKAIV